MASQKKTIIITFILTTLFWFCVIYAYGLWINKQQEQYAEEEYVDYSEDIIGTWEPIEVSEKTLEFNYGVLKETKVRKYGYETSSTRPYRLDGDELQFFWDGHTLSGIIEIYDEGGKTYLIINDLSSYAGKYVKRK